MKSNLLTPSKGVVEIGNDDIKVWFNQKTANTVFNILYIRVKNFNKKSLSIVLTTEFKISSKKKQFFKTQ